MNWLAFELLESLGDKEKSDLACINSILYSVAAVMSFKEGQEFTLDGMKKIEKGREVPKWKQRLEKQIGWLRKEADILKALLENKVKNVKASEFAKKVLMKYRVDGSRAAIMKLVFIVKEKISILGCKVRRYEKRIRSKTQNETFQKDKKVFYRSIFEEENAVKEPPCAEDIREFWGNRIWGDSGKYSGQPSWFEEVKKSYKNVNEQIWTGVTDDEVKTQLSRSMNWKAPGIDCLSNFWLKSMPCCFKFLASTMNNYIEQPSLLPEWVVRGRTTLLPKSNKTTDATQYRPITCLITYWKCLSGILSEKITKHLNESKILADEQQGAVKNSYGTKTQLIINKTIVEDAIRRKRDISMVYIDYAKAYDSVPHQWTLDVMEAYKISPVIIQFLSSAMKLWKTDLYLYYDGGCVLVEEVQFKRGIYQGDSLSPLLFIISINPISLLLNRKCRGYKLEGINLTHILYMDDLKGYCDSPKSLEVMCHLIEEFTKDIGMELGLSKCGVIHMSRGRYASLGGIILKSGGVIQELQENEHYKYLGIEELIGIDHEKVKDNVWKKAKAKLRKLLETELSSINMVVAINECVLPIITYSFGVVNWLEGDLKQLDVNIRKLLHMNKMFQIKNDVDRLYGSREAGGRGLISVWDSFKMSIIRIAHSIENSENDVLQICYKLDKKKLHSNEKKAKKYVLETPIEYPKGFDEKPVLHQAKIKAALVKKKQLEARINVWQDKPQHGAYLRQLKEIGADLKESFGWLKKCFLDPFTESYVCAAQEMALFTKYHEKNILKVRSDSTCRICKCKDSEETIYHILSGCDSLAKREYFVRHNAVCKYLHFVISKAYGIPHGENWFMHKPREVIIHNKVELLYDQIILTDMEVGANRPDLVVKDTAKKKTYIIDVSCPCDLNIYKKEAAKIAKYVGLKGQLQKMWGFDCIIIPVVVGGLGAVTDNLKDFLAMIPGYPNITMCQKTTLLGSKKILMDVLSRRR